MHKLYFSPGACSMAPHIVLEEIGKPFETELVSTTGGRMTDTPEWRAINPKGRVPVLTGVPGRMGGAENVLTEVVAILYWLARTNPDAKLFPSDPDAQARCLEWMSWLTGSVHSMSYAQLWRPQRFVRDESLYPAVSGKGMDNIREQYAYIEGLLADGRDWAVPGGYSIVDPYLLVFFYWGQRIKLDMRADYPAWSRVTDAVLARPVVQRVLEAEKIVIA